MNKWHDNERILDKRSPFILDPSIHFGKHIIPHPWAGVKSPPREKFFQKSPPGEDFMLEIMHFFHHFYSIFFVD